MVTIELADEDAALLKQCLEVALSELRIELSSADGADFRERLEQEKAALEHAVSQLP